MSALACAYHEISRAYHIAAERETSAILKQCFKDKRDHFHDEALRWEAKHYQTNTEQAR